MFCLQNHPKYAPIYLNLPNGNDFRDVRRLEIRAFEGLPHSGAMICLVIFVSCKRADRL